MKAIRLSSNGVYSGMGTVKILAQAKKKKYVCLLLHEILNRVGRSENVFILKKILYGDKWETI